MVEVGDTVYAANTPVNKAIRDNVASVLSSHSKRIMNSPTAWKLLCSNKDLMEDVLQGCRSAAWRDDD